MPLKIRKIVKIVEEMRREIGRDLDESVQVVTVPAVMKNPWAGQGYVEDLKPLILEVPPSDEHKWTDRHIAGLNR